MPALLKCSTRYCFWCCLWQRCSSTRRPGIVSAAFCCFFVTEVISGNSSAFTRVFFFKKTHQKMAFETLHVFIDKAWVSPTCVEDELEISYFLAKLNITIRSFTNLVLFWQKERKKVRLIHLGDDLCVFYDPWVNPANRPAVREQLCDYRAPDSAAAPSCRHSKYF